MKVDEKLAIRVILILASSCMVIANFSKGGFALAASALFLLANALALVVNLRKKSN